MLFIFLSEQNIICFIFLLKEMIHKGNIQSFNLHVFLPLQEWLVNEKELDVFGMKLPTGFQLIGQVVCALLIILQVNFKHWGFYIASN